MTADSKWLCIIFTLVTCVATPTSAETDVDRVQRIMEKAARQGSAMYQAELERRRSSGPLQQLPDLGRGASVPSPEELAKQYAELKKEAEGEHKGLLVFVSASMPIASLELLADQVGKVGGTLVLRGFIGGMHKGAMPETMKFLRPLAERGADVEVNPEAFDRFSVEVVPTFAIVSRHMDCAAEICDGAAALVAGDVSLEYALEEVTRKGGRGSAEAGRYLKLLRVSSKRSGG